MQHWSKRSRNRLYGHIFFLVIFVVIVWVASLFYFVENIPKVSTDIASGTDAIVVLTGGSKRLNEGLRLLESNNAERLFISGVYKGTEVRSLLNLSNQNQFDLASKVSIGNAENTRENAEETARWISENGLNSLRLVTAAYHMPRSLIEFSYVMPKVKIIPNPVFPEHVKHQKWWSYPGTAALFVSEYCKFLLALFRQKLGFLKL